MRILIVNNMAPFIWGGAEELAVNLKRNLQAAGHEAELLRVPFSWDPPSRIPSQMLMARALELRNVDHVIALKFPAYLIRHPRKTLWLLHQFRQAYDLYDAGHSNLVTAEGGSQLRQVIFRADDECLAESRAVFTNSAVTQKRLQQYNSVTSKVLSPPLNDPELFTGGEARGYIFAGGRVNSLKRQHLLLEALARTPRETRLIVAGPPDTEADAVTLKRLTEVHDLGDRVRLDLRFLSRAEYAKYVNECSAVAYIPYDEDSMGYVTMEAVAAGKPIVTARDSGGVLALAKHERTGWVCTPDPDSLAKAFIEVLSNTRRAAKLGLAGRRRWTSLGIDWPTTISKLLQ